MTISHWFGHYGLLILALAGVVECVRVLRIALLDMRMLTTEGVNGPKKLSVVGRLTQSGFLLATFSVLLAVGGRIALSGEGELEGPLVLTLVTSCDVIALVLMVKEITIRRTRTKLDAYYDSTQQQISRHGHRRRTDDDAC